MGAEGGVIWNCFSVSRMTGEGMASSVRLSCAFQAPATGPNGVHVISEQEISADGSVKTTLWEWE